MRALSKGVIRKMPSAATKCCQSYNDILNELVVSQALSQLHEGVIVEGQTNGLFRAPFFCLIHEIKVVSGNLEKTLSRSRSDSATKGLSQQPVDEQSTQQTNHRADDHNRLEPRDEDLRSLSEDDRMLVEALPHEYVVSVMRHDGQPLWWMMSHKKLTPEQLTSVLVQVIVGIAIAETVYLYEHRDLHVSNILIKKTTKSLIPFVLSGKRYNILSNGIKATIIDATFSRLSHNGKVYFRDLTSTLRAYGTKKTPTKMSLQNRSYRQMVHVTKNNWEQFVPKTNLIWLTYLCETFMKNEVMSTNTTLLGEIKKIRDYTLKVGNTYELLKYFPFDRDKSEPMESSGKTATQKAQMNASQTGTTQLTTKSQGIKSIKNQVIKSLASTAPAQTNGARKQLTREVQRQEKSTKSNIKQPAIQLDKQQQVNNRQSKQLDISSQQANALNQDFRSSIISKVSESSNSSAISKMSAIKSTQSTRSKQGRKN